MHLAADGGAEREDVDAEFWARISTRPYEGMRLLAVIRHDADTPHWEMHPAGDELLYQLSGASVVVLGGEGGAGREVELGAGRACVVPRGTWHRLVVREPGLLLFVTPGAGTEHRPL
ncbi:MAG: cupin domain-containing protein [Acidobacteriota bacterium]|nr:cupin domain-containing protein [Acidobacteriota bacterium]